jgi:malonyl-CoA/methylmalonyl-CoA synthetase
VLECWHFSASARHIMSLASLFSPTFSSRANAVALEWACQEYTFADLDARAGRMAHELSARGLARGDRLAIYLPNRIEYVDLFLACTRLGVIVVPINVLYRDREMSHILGDATPKAVVVADEAAWGRADQAAWSIDVLTAAASAQPRGSLDTTLEEATPAALVYTSGTTGPAKGAVITHGNLAANARMLVDAWRFAPADRLLLALPLFHVHGLGNGVHCWLLSGCRTRLLERFDHASAAATLLDFRPTVFFGVPTMYVRLLEVEPASARAIGAAFRLCVSGSAPLPAQVLEDFAARFGQRILERYGMTETLMTLGNPYDGERRAGTVGFPFPGVSIRIVDERNQDVPDDGSGELLVQSPTVCAGYWNRPDATAAAFAGGWFKTGDVARRAPDGYITLCGRRSDVIISGGFNIYPREIEELLAEHPCVAEVAVAGTPDSVRGEVPVAFVVPAVNTIADADSLIAHCREQLASFKVPRRVVFLESLPRTALGKVQKSLLRVED